MTDAEITHALLRELITEIRGLRQAYERQSRRPSITREDLQRLASLLPAIETAFTDHPFTAKEVHEALQGLTRTLSVKSLGRLLLRGEGLAIDGYVIERLGTECNRTLWRLSRALVSEVSRGLETSHPTHGSALLRGARITSD
jgi:hypothetical protein